MNVNLKTLWGWCVEGGFIMRVCGINFCEMNSKWFHVRLIFRSRSRIRNYFFYKIKNFWNFSALFWFLTHYPITDTNWSINRLQIMSALCQLLYPVCGTFWRWKWMKLLHVLLCGAIQTMPTLCIITYRHIKLTNGLHVIISHYGSSRKMKHVS